MKKLGVFLLIVVNIILIIAVICLYFFAMQISKSNLESTLTQAEVTSHIGSRVSDLEDTVKELEEELENLNNQ